MVLKFIGVFVVAIYILFGGYLMMMPLLRAREEKRLTNEALVLAAPWIVLFLLLDFSFNVTFGTILFLDIPREWMLTQRLERYLFRDFGQVRRKMAKFFCTRLLDRFDPEGKHCR